MKQTAGLVVLAGLMAVLTGLVAGGEHGHSAVHDAADRESALRREIATLSVALNNRQQGCTAPAAPRSGDVSGTPGDARPGAGGGAPAAPQAETPPPPSGDSTPQSGPPGALPAACLDPSAGPPKDVVLIFDTSLSMRLPMTLSLREELALRGGRADGGDGPNGTALRDLMEAPGEKRLDVARQAALALLGGLPPASRFGLVLFGREAATGLTPLPHDQACDVHAFAPEPGPDRDAPANALANWPAKAWTPIARALDRSADMLKEEGAVFLITDGQETCHGDPCTAARRLKTRHPGARVYVVDIMGNPGLHCIAAETGGELVRWTSAGAAAAFMLAAAAPAEHCPR